ncbi:hypothetical protein EDD11_005635 [Mortierella claussenii]|nr:hypothetical protein EDD11_005635 [Mortierella claussenii]
MGQWFDDISPDHADWIKKQKIFFVATAPLDGRGCVNSSPKGHDSLRVLGSNQVCYLELSGSGIETQAHLEENGRITVMFTAFEGGPRIMRLIGTGRVIRLGTPEFNRLLETQYKGSLLYDASGKRSIIMIDVRKVGTSCGYSVPFYEYKGERLTLINSFSKRDEAAIKEYWMTANKYSLDGLPGMRHEMLGEEWVGKNRKEGQEIVLPDYGVDGIRGGNYNNKWYSADSLSAWIKSRHGAAANVGILSVGIMIGVGWATWSSRRR